MNKPVAAALAATLIGGCAVPPSAPEAARRELAPTGTLRAGMNWGNTLFTQKTAAGAPTGVSVDIMRELAARLGVPLELVMHDSPGQVADAAGRHTWDVAILAIEPARARSITFSPPLSEIEAGYVVRQDGPLKGVAQVDAPGVRIAAPAKAGYELYLTRTLQAATLVRTDGFDASISLFNAGGADAVAALKPNLIEAMTRMPGGRLLDGRFMTVHHGLGTPVGRDAGAGYLKAFVADLNATGFIARSIERHRVQGLSAVR
ncbi:MAG: transporter substrate-binding domain-containing protein [Rubrivivax sp.]